jgi:hypothetical protein
LPGPVPDDEGVSVNGGAVPGADSRICEQVSGPSGEITGMRSSGEQRLLQGETNCVQGCTRAICRTRGWPYPRAIRFQATRSAARWSAFSTP